MHKQVASRLSAGGSPGRLALYARSLQEKGYNIRAIGGAEWEHHGTVGVLLDQQPGGVELDTLIEQLEAEGFPTQEIFAAEAVLPDVPGALADACEAIGELNIATILVVDSHGGKSLVTFGFTTRKDARLASKRLQNVGPDHLDVSVEEHTLTEAWTAHEAWDAANPNQPPPDPANP